MSRSFSLALTLITVLYCGCKKNSASPGDNSTESTKYILLSTEDSTGGGIMCINADKTVRWHRTGMADYRSSWVYYNDGIVYAPYPESNFNTGVTLGKFYAIDVNTGKDVWSIKQSRDIFSNVYVHDGTLYGFVQSTTGTEFYLAALNAKTGSELWRVPANTNYIADIIVDGNTLYFNQVVSSLNYSLTAFNLTTKTIQWQTQTNTFTNAFSGPS